MITFTVKIDPAGIKGDVAKEAVRLAKRLAFEIEAAMKLLMTGPKSGRAYQRGGGVHIASAPGEAPAVDTSFLINSIQTVPTSTGAEITIAAEYAEALEFGTDRVAARPFVRPAIESVLKRFDSGGFLATARD